ncbi:hypothetical protein [Acinetobacter calcoaceticus]|uniref:hypothetical protein n=1 Tax=Acinetobacter calcoaceticus TaxID=471 RepID=UPI00124D0E9D|nr:hypothetical protein [Acinetobacter calcoaceticus]
MTDVSSITIVRNRLVYVLIAIAISLTAMSLLSYFYVFSFLLWLLLIVLFFGILGFILKLSNQIFDINNPVIEQNSATEDAIVNATTEAVPEEPKPIPKERKNVVRNGLLLASLLAWVVLFSMSGLNKLFN